METDQYRLFLPSNLTEVQLLIKWVIPGVLENRIAKRDGKRTALFVSEIQRQSVVNWSSATNPGRILQEEVRLIMVLTRNNYAFFFLQDPTHICTEAQLFLK